MKSKKKSKKYQMGGNLIPLPLENLNTEKVPDFKSANEYYAWHRKQALARMKPEDVELYNKELEHSQANADAIIALRDPSGGFAPYKPKSKPKPVPYGNVLGRAYGLKNGGVIEDNRGQWAHPGKVTKIKSNKITMKGVKTPVIGISDTGDLKMMYPDNEYLFDGSEVTEYPIRKKAQWGNNIPNWGQQYAPNSTATYNPNSGIVDNITGKVSMQDTQSLGLDTNNLEKIGNTIGQAMPIVGDLVQGFQMIKEQKRQKQQAKQFKKLSGVVRQASELEPDKVQRKYVRPEDQIIDPNTVASSYGVGTNFLAKNGKKLQLGGDISNILTNISGSGNEGNFGNMLGSLIGGGQGQQTGAGKIGSTIGGIAGSFIPGGQIIGSAVGGIIGGIIGGKGQKEIQKNQKAAQKNLGMAAFNQGTKSLHNQYTSFMKHGGSVLEDSGELETLWGGEVEPISYNPYLPDAGESVMFKGDSHDEGGIGINYGKNKIEVEGGEPAVKLKDGGNNDSLTVFGNMKIPSYGVSELNDPKAKGKKFKNYITELSKIEDKQNKILEKGTELIENSDMNDPYEKLTFSSGKAMIEGGNMKLKNIAEKKQIASNIQSAILDTAEELNLDSDALAKGKVKKGKAKTAQSGTKLPQYIQSEEIESWLNQGFEVNPDNPNQLFRKRVIPGSEVTLPSKTIGQAKQYKNLMDRDKWFTSQIIPMLDQGISPDELVSKKWLDPRDKEKAQNYFTKRTSTTPPKEEWDYIDIYDPPKTKPSEGSSVQFIDQVNDQEQERGNFDWMTAFNSVLPMLRPSNQRPLDPNQLSGEMFALSTNQLEPVQAQLYEPLLEQVSDISLQDQLNANQADFNAIKRLTANNPAAQAILAGQKYQANSKVLADQFRLNQAQKMGTYNKNREILNDATLKNLQILDQQYVRQAGAKSKTKATAQAALNSIADKIAKNKLENRTLGIYENLYNYRFGPNGYAWNMNPLAQFNTQGSNLPIVDSQGKEITEVATVSTRRDRLGMPLGTTTRQTQIKKPKKKGNGGIVKSMKNY